MANFYMPAAKACKNMKLFLQVVTIRFRDFHEYKLRPLGPSHTEIMLSFNNSDGRLPFVSRDESGKFEMPVELLWQEGLALSSLFKLPSDPWILVKGKIG